MTAPSDRDHSAVTSLATREDVDRFIYGITLLSTGGGGLPDRGRDYLYELLDDGLLPSWQPIESIRGDSLTCTAFGMGSIAPHDEMDEDALHRAGYVRARLSRPAVSAVEELEQLVGARIDCIVPMELGGFNTVQALDAAVRLNRVVIDGDYCGRALPEMSQMLPAALGLSPFPIAICDEWGTVAVLKDSPSMAIAEATGKMISVITKAPDMRAECIHACFPLRVSSMSHALVRGTLSHALTIGRRVIDAREAGYNPVDIAVDAIDGRMLFIGTVSSMQWENADGYMTGTTHLNGRESFDGRRARIWFRNENHVIWVDDTVVASSPDLIIVLSQVDASPITNSTLSVGTEVAVIGTAASSMYRSGEALHRTEPRHFGIAVDYIPIEYLD